ncbi:hypothetical protein [Aestuariibacter salexigens]|uniref:GT-D fold domain-containing protein n=1 Tax=Aestuariibacter salexigens TaxID=226010 RepID=UPI00047E8393|nr:hypothetical protein [Aestuariibacter salexigens]
MDESDYLTSVFSVRQSGFVVFYELLQRIKNKQPTSLIRLGDGEGAILGYPDITSRKHVNSFFNTWYGHTDFPEEAIVQHHRQLKEAILAADIVGLPREKQINKSPRWAAVEQALMKHQLIDNSLIITDAAIHRYLTFALFYRPLLANQPFLGIISCRDVATKLARVFHIDDVAHYPIKGESACPGDHDAPHFPNDFEKLRATLTVPFKGAIFLVGAGVLGKTYCQWIKERGGIAIDIGSMFDAWEGAPTRTRHPVHKLERYLETPTISLPEAVERYNATLVDRELDGQQVDINDLPSGFPASW